MSFPLTACSLPGGLRRFGQSVFRISIYFPLLLSLMSGVSFPARCSSFFAQAQHQDRQATATISGVVADENGAAIRGATVTILDRANTLERQLVTGEDGGFTFLLLSAGEYVMRAQSNGFAPVEIRNLLLGAGEQRAIRISLKVGELGASVSINGEAAPANAPQFSGLGLNLNREWIENLPFNGRSFLSLAALAPGVVLTRATADEQGQFSVAGQRANANYFSVDGVSANAGITATASLGQAGAGALPALGATGGTNSLVSIEALQEFRIQTSSYAAEFGRMPGGQVSLTTRSGTNAFHGALFEYFRNDALDANDWFANRAGLPKAALRQNDFGGALSGPVAFKPLPDGSNRTFFFFSYEALRLWQPLFSKQLVPSVNARQKGSAAIQAITNS